MKVSTPILSTSTTKRFASNMTVGEVKQQVIGTIPMPERIDNLQLYNLFHNGELLNDARTILACGLRDKVPLLR